MEASQVKDLKQKPDNCLNDHDKMQQETLAGSQRIIDGANAIKCEQFGN